MREVVFDKTGTLTRGRPRVADVMRAGAGPRGRGSGPGGRGRVPLRRTRSARRSSRTRARRASRLREAADVSACPAAACAGAVGGRRSWWAATACSTSRGSATTGWTTRCAGSRARARRPCSSACEDAAPRLGASRWPTRAAGGGGGGRPPARRSGVSGRCSPATTRAPRGAIAAPAGHRRPARRAAARGQGRAAAGAAARRRAAWPWWATASTTRPRWPPPTVGIAMGGAAPTPRWRPRTSR